MTPKFISLEKKLFLSVLLRIYAAVVGTMLQCYMISAWWIMQGSHSKHGWSVSYDPAVSMAVRETARKLESDFAGRSAWCEDRGSGYNYGRRWTYLQGNIPYLPLLVAVKFQLNSARFYFAAVC